MPTVVKNDAGEVLQNYLKSHGIKQTWLADKLGLSPSQLGDRLHGRLKFNADFAIQVASVLGISADIFLKENYAKRVK
ncbi:helix-turn-helix domain-containing protein [Lactobacillus sp.]|uniref:helix-turn-helix transcriptional regulator n=1 Tax=Lactobacillus sp. TaxID=1591 RepID=UPI0019BB5F20|nr:helix-turn-helix domain-containing protein [Lactobacillus sp.]MBD5430112.1 helix-turn-helix domain-containing protein [Lactobacillus sp.]